MISHLSLGVRDLETSGRFYDAVFAPLGFTRFAEVKDGELAYGPGGQGVFWLYEIPGEGPLASAGTHIAFQVADRRALHSAAAAASGAGCSFTREAGAHPDIAPDYYGAILLDPDGHKLELVVE